MTHEESNGCPILLSEYTGDVKILTYKSKEQVDMVLNDLGEKLSQGDINWLLDKKSELPEREIIKDYLIDL